MIWLYYSSDPGVLEEYEQFFFAKHPNSFTITVQNYYQLFHNLDQNCFTANTAYYIKDAALLGSNWMRLEQKGSKLADNLRQVDDWLGLITKLSKQNINFLITVYTDELLKSKTISRFLKTTVNQDHQIKKLTTNDHQKYLTKLLTNHQITLDDLATNYLYELFPNNIQLINQVFVQIQLYNKKHLTFQELQQIVGINHDINYYQIVDAWLIGRHYEWISLFNQHCQTTQAVEALWNVLIYKFNEFYHYCQLRRQGNSVKLIMEFMNKAYFMIQNYEKAFVQNKKLSNKINWYVVKLVELSSLIRQSATLTPQLLKLTLLEF